jgi:hypothetical protein
MISFMPPCPAQTFNLVHGEDRRISEGASLQAIETNTLELPSYVLGLTSMKFLWFTSLLLPGLLAF